MSNANSCYVTIINMLPSGEISFSATESIFQELMHMCVTVRQKGWRRKNKRHFCGPAATTSHDEHQVELGQILL